MSDLFIHTQQTEPITQPANHEVSVLESFVSVPDKFDAPQDAVYMGAGMLMLAGGVTVLKSAINRRRINSREDIGGETSTMPGLLEVSVDEAAAQKPNFIRTFGAPIVGATGLAIGLLGMSAQPVNVDRPSPMEVSTTFDYEYPNLNSTNTYVVDMTDSMRYTDDIQAQSGEIVDRQSAIFNSLRVSAENAASTGSTGTVRVIGVAGTGTVQVLFDGDLSKLASEGIQGEVVPTGERIDEGLMQAISLESLEQESPSDPSARRVTLVTDGNVDATGIDVVEQQDAVQVDTILIGTQDSTYKIYDFSEPRDSGIDPNNLGLDLNDLNIVVDEQSLTEKFTSDLESSGTVKRNETENLIIEMPEIKHLNLLPITVGAAMIVASLGMAIERMRKFRPVSSISIKRT